MFTWTDNSNDVIYDIGSISEKQFKHLFWVRGKNANACFAPILLTREYQIFWLCQWTFWIFEVWYNNVISFLRPCVCCCLCAALITAGFQWHLDPISTLVPSISLLCQWCNVWAMSDTNPILFRPYFDPISTLVRSISLLCRWCNIWAMSDTNPILFRPYLDPISIRCQSYVDPISIFEPSYFDTISARLRPYFGPIPTLTDPISIDNDRWIAIHE